MLNRCEFIGNLGRDPEIRTTQAGEKVANMSLAVTEKWKDKSGERQERTTWVPVVAWGKVAEIAEQYLHKGSKIFVAGQFTVRKWQDQQGNDRYSTEVVLRPFRGELVMLDGKPNDQSGDRTSDIARQADANYDRQVGGGELDDEIPF